MMWNLPPQALIISPAIPLDAPVKGSWWFWSRRTMQYCRTSAPSSSWARFSISHCCDCWSSRSGPLKRREVQETRETALLWKVCLAVSSSQRFGPVTSNHSYELVLITGVFTISLSSCPPSFLPDRRSAAMNLDWPLIPTTRILTSSSWEAEIECETSCKTRKNWVKKGIVWKQRLIISCVRIFRSLTWKKETKYWH